MGAKKTDSEDNRAETPEKNTKPLSLVYFKALKYSSFLRESEKPLLGRSESLLISFGLVERKMIQMAIVQKIQNSRE